MKRRRYPRFSAHYDGVYAGEGIAGQGKILDVSRSGCRIRTDEPPMQGTAVSMLLRFADERWPIKIDEALVRWSHAGEFGVEFTRMHGLERVRLEDLLDSLQAAPGAASGR